MVRAIDVAAVPITICKKATYSRQCKERQRGGRTCQRERRPGQRPHGRGSAACSRSESGDPWDLKSRPTREEEGEARLGMCL